MILRPATAGDAAAICAITNAVIRDTLITFTTSEKTQTAVAPISQHGATRLLWLN